MKLIHFMIRINYYKFKCVSKITSYSFLVHKIMSFKNFKWNNIVRFRKSNRNINKLNCFHFKWNGEKSYSDYGNILMFPCKFSSNNSSYIYILTGRHATTWQDVLLFAKTKVSGNGQNLSIARMYSFKSIKKSRQIELSWAHFTPLIDQPVM